MCAGQVATMIEVTTWQSVNTVCHCSLTPGSCVEATGPIILATAVEAITYQKKTARVLLSVRAISTYPTACAESACVQHAYSQL